MATGGRDTAKHSGLSKGTLPRSPVAVPRWGRGSHGRAPGSARGRRRARALRAGSPGAGAAGFVFPFPKVQVTFADVQLVQACPERAGPVAPARRGSAGDAGERMIPQLLFAVCVCGG